MCCMAKEVNPTLTIVLRVHDTISAKDFLLYEVSSRIKAGAVIINVKQRRPGHFRVI